MRLATYAAAIRADFARVHTSGEYCVDINIMGYFFEHIYQTPPHSAAAGADMVCQIECDTVSPRRTRVWRFLGNSFKRNS